MLGKTDVHSGCVGNVKILMILIHDDNGTICHDEQGLSLKLYSILPPYWPPFRSSDISEYWIFCDIAILDGITTQLDKTKYMDEFSRKMALDLMEAPHV